MLRVLASRLQFADEVVANIAVVAFVEEGIDVEVELESLVEDKINKFGKIWYCLILSQLDFCFSVIGPKSAAAT